MSLPIARIEASRIKTLSPKKPRDLARRKSVPASVVVTQLGNMMRSLLPTKERREFNKFMRGLKERQTTRGNAKCGK
jgi:hypothetical protein